MFQRFFAVGFASLVTSQQVLGDAEADETSYTFGVDCGKLDGGLCGSNCLKCSWSWPVGDPDEGKSDEAACRCQESGPSADFEFGKACRKSNGGDCGDDCLLCSWSWPSGDPRRGSSPDAGCRCEMERDLSKPRLADPIDINTPVKYSGNQCGDAEPDYCESGCEYCRRSWPFFDDLKWRSEDFGCRCIPRQRAPEGYVYTSVEPEDKSQGLCNGCDSCRWSYPKDAPSLDYTGEREYRCAPTKEYVYTICECFNKYEGDCGIDCQACHWSWEAGEGRKDQKCRCLPWGFQEVSWGEPCENLDDGECGSYCKDCRLSFLTYSETEPNTCRCRNW